MTLQRVLSAFVSRQDPRHVVWVRGLDDPAPPVRHCTAPARRDRRRGSDVSL